MTVPGKKARDLVELYRVSLEHRIEQGDWNLVCRDEELIKKVEGLLMGDCAQDTHSLGLDPLSVMEDSLQTAQGVGLKGLARAFEVLELASLNLYLCPWRKEYRVVKMFSGMFTHYIKPALSMQQVADLFGLLGYQASEARLCEELRLCSPALPVDTLLRLSCAFFTARCECRLLLSAIVPQGRRVEWELNLVQERQKGHSLQIALDNSKRRLETIPQEGDFPESSTIEADLDLYTDDEFNGHKEVGLVRDPLCSPRRVYTRGLSSQRENICVSSLNCQLIKTSSLAPTRNTPTHKQRESPNKELAMSGSDKGDSQLLSAKASGNAHPVSPGGSQFCIECYPSPCIHHCKNCNTLRSLNCPILESCKDKGHEVKHIDGDEVLQEQRESSGLSPRLGSPGEGGVPLYEDKREFCPSLDVFEAGSLTPQPIPFHDCCNIANPDPEVTCLTCKVFHTRACKMLEMCQRKHKMLMLDVCSSGLGCPRPPCKLCRYCSVVYCKDCWYRTPLQCVCGYPFDESSEV
ncbi:spermatogenesis associated 2-like [Oncorhynchus masou masou]|uniref:spermatogenesis associated 2-like n=1 Tax=Oncorhynchus masou masou TaxID=90313 RepID=UPI003183CD80